jgi:aspartyl-tRNA synthetase
MTQQLIQRRTHTCGQPREGLVGQTITTNGWVHGIREVGGIVFVDLRDRTGVLQLVFDREDSAPLHETAKRLAREFVIGVTGTVRARGRANPDLPTGGVEVVVKHCDIFNPSKTPPFEVKDGAQSGTVGAHGETKPAPATSGAATEVDPEIRATFRYIDLRRPSMQHMLRTRHRLVKAIRDYFDGQNFVEVETPYLTKATPEGARDFVVPARLHPGLFYALPQSPQIFKQILMVAGTDRYFQIVRCFRDEDKRSDRQPEFTQLDVEMAFPVASDVHTLLEGCIGAVMTALGHSAPKTPLMHMPYDTAMREYGNDKPDVRFGMKLVDWTEAAKSCGFGVFSQTAQSGGVVKVLCIPGGDALISKGQFKKVEQDARGRGAKGLAYARYRAEGPDSSFLKFLTEPEQAAFKAATNANTGDLVLVIADRAKVANAILADFRLLYGAQIGLRKRGHEDGGKHHSYHWVDDFPLFEYDEETNRLFAAHHPFTSPHDDAAFLALAEEMRRTDRKVTPKIVDLAQNVKANAYDLVMNGIELGGGSIRIHRKEVQDAMFDCLGIGPEEARNKFGFLLDALSFGAPPMGGIALGIDRWVMEMLGYDNIQDVIAFPKSSGGKGLMDGSPSNIDAAQMKELCIRTAVGEA